MKRFFNIALASIVILFSMTSCIDNLPDGFYQDAEHQKEHNNLKVLKVDFSKNYKNIHVKVKVPSNISIYSLNDTTKYHYETEESNLSNKKKRGTDLQPMLSDIKNIHKQELDKSALSLLLLVDLTIPQEEVDQVKKNIQQMRKWFGPSNLYISFMQNEGVTASMPITDYIMDNYFVSSNSKSYLYRSILEKLKEIQDYQSLSRDQKGLIVFSDGDVYVKDQPIDPQHYQLQEELLRINSNMGYSSVEYINYGAIYEEGESNEAKNIIKELTKHTQGIYLDKFDWSKLLADLMNQYKLDYADYQLDFVNPDNKVYIGKLQHLRINIYDGNKLLATGCAEYSIGSIYDPVIINGISRRQVILQGCLIALLFFVFAYFILQIIIPYFSYKHFKRKYVTHYTKEGMILNGIQVSRSCYYCKAPFEEGDEIVVKCKHVVHKECWDENEYKCPEAGRHCKEGSHYYNANNLFDGRNAPFYISWAMAGILAGLAAWIAFIVLMVLKYKSGGTLYSLLLLIRGLQAGTPDAQMAYDLYIKHLTRLPRFGFCLNFFITFALSYLSQHSYPFKLRFQWATAKALVCGLLGYIIYLLTSVVSIIFDMKTNSWLIDWIPWATNGFVIAYIATYFTHIKLRKIFIGISCAVGFGMMFVWTNLMFNSVMDNREELLICLLVYSIAMAVSIAVVAPKSERYFLHVEGAIKPMDIALYKWMRTSPLFKVTIGKSINCNLQMSWDYGSQIAPLQASITREKGKLYLTAEEEGVMVNDRPLAIEDKIQLYHGQKFTIGKTVFTYVEKDT